MVIIDRRHQLAVLICLMSLSVVALDATAQSSDPEQANYGDTIEEHFDIASIRIGSRDADRSGTATYRAPTGFTILGHRLQRGGHHSGVAHVETTQPGRLAYESRAMVSLRDAMRRGFINGTLSVTDDESVSGSATDRYLNFLKRFEGEYHFVADTQGAITFSWFVDSKSFDHGALLEATAVVRLRKAATEADVERVAEVIRFAIESGERRGVFELIDNALGVPRPSN